MNQVLKTIKIERSIYEVHYANNEGKLCRIRYKYQTTYKGKYHTKYFKTLDEALSYKKAFLTKVELLRAHNEIDNLLRQPVSDYPDNLLSDLNITYSNCNNYYDYVVPNFNDTLLCDQVGLSEREKDIINERYFKKETLDSISQTHDLTRERVRQILIKILRKLTSKKDLFLPPKEVTINSLISDLKTKKITESNLSVRCCNQLKKGGYENQYDLAFCDFKRLLQSKIISKSSYVELTKNFQTLNLPYNHFELKS